MTCWSADAAQVEPIDITGLSKAALFFSGGQQYARVLCFILAGLGAVLSSAVTFERT